MGTTDINLSRTTGSTIQLGVNLPASMGALQAAIIANLPDAMIWTPPAGVTNGQQIANGGIALTDKQAGGPNWLATLTALGKFSFFTGDNPIVDPLLVAGLLCTEMSNNWAAVASALGASGAKCGGIVYKLDNTGPDTTVLDPIGIVGAGHDTGNGDQSGQTILMEGGTLYSGWVGNTGGGSTAWTHFQWRSSTLGASPGANKWFGPVGGSWGAHFDGGASQSPPGQGLQIGLGGSTNSGQTLRVALVYASQLNTIDVSGGSPTLCTPLKNIHINGGLGTA